MKFVDVVDKQLGKAYALGYSDRGCDCVGLMWGILTDLGFSLPYEFEGYNILKGDYVGLHLDIEKASEWVVKIFHSFGDPVPLQYIKAGDILLIKMKDKPVYYMACYTGNGKAITSFIRSGVRVFQLDELNKAVEARRMVKSGDGR